MDLKRATVKAFDIPTYKATVQIEGSLPLWLSGLSVARNIASAEMAAGRKCAILFFDETNPDDAVVIAVYT